MRKSLLFIALLSVSSLVFAGTKAYSFVITAPIKVGGAQLAKGNYKITLAGDKATFTDDHDKSVSVPAKVDAGAGKKFEFTSVEATQKDGADVVKLIHLGGSTTTIEFGL